MPITIVQIIFCQNIKKYDFIREIITDHELEIDDEADFMRQIIQEISLVKGQIIPLAYYHSGCCGDEVFKEIYRAYEEKLHENRWIDFDDILVYTYELLKEREDIRKAWQQKFPYILIDEFQDTDQMQVESDTLPRRVRGRRALCTVGDAQQSIYRFRGAEVEVFRRQERKVGSSAAPEATAVADAPAGELVKLVRNFRSHDEVLRYVARVFDGDDGGLMQGFLDLEASDGRKDTLVADASRRQALFVPAAVCRSAHRPRPARSPSASARLPMPASPQGGMVLLLGRMTNADVYAQAFRDQGLDCVIAGGSALPRQPRCRRCVPWSARSPIRPIRRRALCRCSPRRCLRSAPRSSWRWRPSSMARRGRPRAGISTWAS